MAKLMNFFTKNVLFGNALEKKEYIGISRYGWINASCLYHCFWPDEDIGNYLSEKGVYRFVFFVWDFNVSEIKQWLVAAQLSRPQDIFHFLCNDEFQARGLQALGLSALHVSHNVFLDEDLYQVQDSFQDKRKFDAVCISRMNRFKRHYLAKDIPRTLFIGAVVSQGDEESYAEELSLLMPNSEMTYKRKRWLDVSAVVQRVQEASVGLILSEVEGGSEATTEYLLCGLPVVSTASRGGRDCWLHPRYSRVVPATSSAINEAVQELKQSAIDPYEVRSYALSVISEQRQRFFSLGQKIYDTESVGRDFSRCFYKSFRHKVSDWQPNKNVMNVWKKMF